MISKERYNKFKEKKKRIDEEKQRISRNIIKPTQKVNKLLTENNSSEISTGVKEIELLKRTEITYKVLMEIDPKMKELSNEELKELEIQVKYEGYIKMQETEVERFKKLEKRKLDETIDYSKITGLRLEARQKLQKIKPNSVGQASRISGVSPADVSVLLIYLEKEKRKKNG